jgi:hypothetical protein
MLGTVVLEGSRAQSRRYGMGNIAGSPEEHRRAYADLLKEAAMELKAAKGMRSCGARTEKAFGALGLAWQAVTNEEWLRGASRTTAGNRIIGEATSMIRSCITQPYAKGVSGARRRR